MTTISDDIRSVSAALGMLAGRLTTDDWALLLLARDNLASLAEQVEGLEQCLVPPAVPTPPVTLPLAQAGGQGVNMAVPAAASGQGHPQSHIRGKSLGCTVQSGDTCARLQ